MRNAELDEAQAGIKIAGRNINNIRYTDDTTLMAESEEELKSLLIKVKEERENAGLKLKPIQYCKVNKEKKTLNLKNLNTPKTMIMASGPITSW